MYDEATILDFDGKKIWVKHINQGLYCVNGCYVMFNKKQDVSNTAWLAYSVDSFYSPWHKGRVEDPESLIGFASVPGEDNRYTVVSSFLNKCKFVTTQAKSVKAEYLDWAGLVDRNTIYVNDCRNDNITEWTEKMSKRFRSKI